MGYASLGSHSLTTTLMSHCNAHKHTHTHRMYRGFTKREVRVSQKANKNIKITLESEPQKEMEGTRGDERSQRQEEGEDEEERLTNDKYQMEKLIKRIQQVERDRE